MSLEELQVVWDAQNDTPQFTVHEAGLHAMVQRRIEESKRRAACRYRTEIAISIVCGLLMLAAAGAVSVGAAWIESWRWPKVAASDWDVAGLIVSGAVWFYFAYYLNRTRVRLQRSGENFDGSLRGDIDRALARLDFQIEIARGIVWRGIAPLGLSAALWVIVLFRLSGGPAWSGLLGAVVALVALTVELFRQQRAIRARHEPQRRELESLRRKLADPER